MTQPGRSDYDVVVVGAGNAALCAALSARENGARVVVLEKAPQEERGGNSYFTGGGFRHAHRGLEDFKRRVPDLSPEEIQALGEVLPYTAEDFYNDLMQVTEGLADPELMEVLINESGPTVDWMAQQGVLWELNNQTGTTVVTRDSGGRMRMASRMWLRAKGAGAGLVPMLFASVEERDIDVLYETKMTKLLLNEHGEISGVTVRDDQGLRDIHGPCVILASGGFEANVEMRVKYMGPLWERAKVRGTKYNTGEAIQAALDIGAKSIGQWTGAHCTPIDASAPPVGIRELTDQTNRLSFPYSIMVDVNGQRFTDEGEDLSGLTYAKMGRITLAQPQGIAFQIFDSKVINFLEARYNTATPAVASTIEDLAQQLDIDTASLVKTVQEFNAAVQPGEFDPGALDGKRTQGITPPKSNWALPIDTPPYHAYAVTGGVTFTFGGLKTDRHAQVIDTEDRVIPGLYATGEITGDFFHYNYPSGTGLTRGAVFGRIAGAQAAARARTLAAKR